MVRKIASNNEKEKALEVAFFGICEMSMSRSPVDSSNVECCWERATVPLIDIDMNMALEREDTTTPHPVLLLIIINVFICLVVSTSR